MHVPIVGSTAVVPRRVEYTLWERGLDMIKDQPFSATFKLDKDTNNTVQYAEEAEGRRPVVGMVYVDKSELGQHYPQRIRVTVEAAE